MRFLLNIHWWFMAPYPAKPGNMMVDKNYHLYLTD